MAVDNPAARSFRVPDGAKGFVATLNVTKASGTFTSEQGINLLIRMHQVEETDRSKSRTVLAFKTKKMSITRPHMIMVYPGATINSDAALDVDGPYIAYPLVAFGHVAINIQIDGDFSDPEDTGFDYYVTIEWLYA
jgi:hypothetical protein